MNTIDYDKLTNRIVITTEWNRENLAKLKNVGTAQYSMEDKTWSIAPDYAFYVAEAFYKLKKTTAFLELIADLNMPVTQEDWLETYLNSTFGSKTLFEHQKEGVKFQLDKSKSIIAADMGTGKTLMALAAVKWLKLPVHIIAPVSLHENWKREAEDVGVVIEKIMSSSNIGDPPDKEVALIVDECHYFQNEKSNRTRQFLNYVNKASFLSLLSGTPVKNGRPSNLYPLLLAIRHPIVQNKTFYFNRYCKVKRIKGQKKPVTTGGSNLIELHNFIADNFFIKTKKECLDLPEKLRILRAAEPTDQEQGMFDFVFKALRQRYFERLRTGKIKESNEAINILGAVRHAASWAKVSTATTLVKELIEEDRPVVLFMNYKDSAEALKSEVEGFAPTAILTSAISPSKRDDIIQDFQAGKYKVLIATYGTGGVGVTLTAASDILLVDRPWTSCDALQAEDRCHRIGTTENVTAIWIQNFNVDRMIDNILIEKQKNINEIMTGKRDTLEFNDNISSQAEEILANIFA